MIDKKGKQAAVHITNEIKTILMIMLYRITQSSNKEVISSIAQYNQQEVEINNATLYRK